MSEKKVKKSKISKSAAIEKLWRIGKLSWKLKGKQVDIYNHFKDSSEDISTCLVSRRFGKTFTMCVLAVEECLVTPNAVVKYVCPTSKMVVNVMQPTVRDIIADCPEDIRPTWAPSEKKWKFPNGSEIQVAGTEGQSYNAIRGGYSHLCLVDEAAFCSELETVVYSVLAPTTDTTNGKIHLASTPNDKDANHEFHEHFIFPNEAAGTLLKMTYLDSPMVSVEKRKSIIKRYPGGETNIKFRCEYLCEIPSVTENSVIPEFTANEENIVKEVEKPEFCDYYTGLDVGFVDLTAALFSYWDYKHHRLVIMDEFVINGPEMTTDKLVKEMRHREKLLYTSSMGQVEPVLRIMDNDLKMVNDLSRFHQMQFLPTEKHNKEAAIDTVRRWIESGKIVIHPRCKHLIYHTKYAQWHVTKQGTWTNKFKHLKNSSDGSIRGGHVDTLDVLIYLVRNIIEGKSPNEGDDRKTPFNSFQNPRKAVDDSSEKGMLQKLADSIMGRAKKD